MNRQSRRSVVAARVARRRLVAVAACTRAAASPSPSPSRVPTAADRPRPPTASPSATPTAGTDRRARPRRPRPTASPAADCVVKPQAGPLPSDRLTDVDVSSTDRARPRSRSCSANASLPGPAGQPTRRPDDRRAAVHRVGQRAADRDAWRARPPGRFMRMSLQPTPATSRTTVPSVQADLPVLRHAVKFDEFEGQIGWYIGYDGPAA